MQDRHFRASTTRVARQDQRRRESARLDETRSVLAALRDLTPNRTLQFSEALRIAELQATRLLALTDVEGPAVPSEVISELPRIRVQRRAIPTSGVSYWDGQQWVIMLNRLEPITRQRFTLFHEYKHIIDHGRVHNLYGAAGPEADRRAEQAADYFAGCVLMSRLQLKRAWASGLQRPAQLARHFRVSERAIAVRLAQTGLTLNRVRCYGIGRQSGRRYYRSRAVTTEIRGATT